MAQDEYSLDLQDSLFFCFLILQGGLNLSRKFNIDPSKIY